MPRFLFPVLVAGLLTTPLHSWPGTAQAGPRVRFEPIALQGDPTPSGGVHVFSRFTAPTIGPDRSVTFEGFGSPSEGIGDSGLFRTADSGLRVIVDEGQIAPGSGGSGDEVPLAAILGPVVNDSGSVAFRGRTAINADGWDLGVFVSSERDGLQEIAFEGDRAPGSGGGGEERPFSNFTSVAIGNGGDVVFTARTLRNNRGGSEGLYTNRRGVLEPVAFQFEPIGVPAPGEDAVLFQSFGRASINRVGTIAYTAITSSAARLMLDGTRGGGPVLSTGDVAPGSGGSGEDVLFREFINPVINDSGLVLFEATTATNADGNAYGAFSYQAGSVRPIAFAGQSMPGSGLGQTDQTLLRLDFGDSLQANDDGTIAFIANTTPNAVGGDSGVFVHDGGSLRGVAFEGLTAPGSGVAEGEADLPFTGFGSLSLNDRGEMIFSATFEPNSAGGRTGVFWSDGETIESILVEGESFTDTAGVLRTTTPGRRAGVSFRAANFSSPTDAFSDEGEIGLLINYGRGEQGIFVATLVPEPTAAFLAALGSFAAAVRLRTSRSLS